jgi:hypothetical protein
MSIKNKDIFTQYWGSKPKAICIPLPRFDFFHKPSTEKEVDAKYIGRDRISDELRNWIQDDSCSGSYLVTGYRGVGKSSFVGKVLNQVTVQNHKYFNVMFMVSMTIACLALALLFREKTVFLSIYIFFLFVFSLIITTLIYYENNIKLLIQKFIFLYQFWTYERKKGESLSLWSIIREIKIHKQEVDFLLNKVKSTKKDAKRVVLRMNLGHEVLNERDILCLIAKGIYDKYRVSVNNYRAHPIFSMLKIGIYLCATTFTYFLFVEDFLQYCFQQHVVGLPWWLSGLWEMISKLFQSNLLQVQVLIAISLFLILLFLMRLISSFFQLRFPYLTCRFFPKVIIKDLNHLIERMEASVSEDANPNLEYTNSMINISFLKKKSRTYPIANVREIEYELIDILDRINELRCFSLAQFIIVFDELDKIDPSYNHDPEQKLVLNDDYENDESGFSGGMNSRKRKQNVLKLLANMKMFVSSAKAKFIFISGRELYDASLADLSDREFAISSIFNGVIYVDSFFESGDNNVKDITNKTEEYICNQLIPIGYVDYLKRLSFFKNRELSPISSNLKLYYQYLTGLFGFTKTEDTYFEKLKQRELCGSEDREQELHAIETMIIFLYKFSVYLSHTSNGSPKKIALYFEKYVKKHKSCCKLEENLFSSIQNKEISNAQYCLYFDETDQLTVGFIHYIAYPIISAVINNSCQYGDKLLVSASFIIDQIYKHHSSGFSWHNLEQTPELLEVYRIPEFRDFMNTIVSYLSKTHLRPILSGTYNFKFRRRVSDEISYFSKISEEISAMFNFTLDESLSVKKYYRKLISNYDRLKSETSRDCNERNDEYDNALIHLHHILGELYLSDEEYTSAVLEFGIALKLIDGLAANSKDNSKGKNSKMTAPLILAKTRNMLKLGYAYECQKTYNAAYAVYSQLATALIEFRTFDENEFGFTLGMEPYDESGDTWVRKRSVLYHRRNKEKEMESSFEKFYPGFWMPEKEMDYSIYGDELISSFSKELMPDKSAIISKVSIFENVRFLYQSLLVKLFVLEKIEIGGITRSNIDVIEGEFTRLHYFTNINEKFIVSVNFFRKLGDIFYYKNGLVKVNHKLFFTGYYFWGYDVQQDILDYCREKSNVIEKAVLLNYVDWLKNLDEEKADTKRIEEWMKEQAEEYERKVYEREEYFMGLPASLRETIKNQRLGYRQIICNFVDSPYFRLPQTIKYSKINHCNKHRETMIGNDFQLPCYACKYYSRSLRILKKYVLENSRIEENDDSKVLDFLIVLKNKQQLVSLRKNYIEAIASTLSTMGDIMLSCSGDREDISEDFLPSFFEEIKSITDNKIDLPKVEGVSTLVDKNLSRLEKSILYYWTASEYYRMASSQKDAFMNLDKVLHIFVVYLNSLKEKAPDIFRLKRGLFSRYLPEINNEILERAIWLVYSYHDYVNLAEIQKIKWLFSKQMYESIPLNLLSVFPELEELIVNYMELELLCCNRPQRAIQYYSTNATNLTLDNTFSERVLSLRFKAIMNARILEEIVCNLGLESFDYTSSRIECQYYTFLHHFLTSRSGTNELLGDFCSCLTNHYFKHYDIAQRLQILEFLIRDSMYCLTKILEMNESTNFALFSNSYIGDVYYQLFNWTQFFEFTFLLYKQFDYGETERSKIESRLKTFVEKRLESENKAGVHQSDYFNECKVPIEEFHICEADLRNINSEGFNNKAHDFFYSVLNCIGKNNIHYSVNNYLAEKALLHYTAAKEMHTEQAAYKEMIQQMYILDDDLNNDTTLFAFAIERYKLNSGYVNRQCRRLKISYRNSTIYDVDNYVKDNSLGVYDFSNRFND